MRRKISEETRLKNQMRSKEWDEKNKEAKRRRGREYYQRQKDKMEQLKKEIEILKNKS